jgi:hypothetical protein
MAVFWVATPYNLIQVFRRFRGACCLHQGDETSETSANFYQTTRRYNPEDRHLHTRRRENLKSHQKLFFETIGQSQIEMRQKTIHTDLTSYKRSMNGYKTAQRNEITYHTASYFNFHVQKLFLDIRF